MGTEGNNIDDLFREKLGVRESFPGPEGWIEAERLLNEKKKKRRGGFWFFSVLMLLAISGFTFWYNSNSSNTTGSIGNNSSNPSSTLGQKNDSATASIQPNQNISADQIENSIPNNESDIAQSNSEVSTNESSSMKNVDLPDETRRSKKTSGGNRRNDDVKSFEVSDSTVENNSDKSNGNDSAMGEKGDSKRPLLFDPFAGELLGTSTSYQPDYITYLDENGIPNELTLIEPSVSEPLLLPPPYVSPLPKTSIEGAMDFAQTRSSFGTSNNAVLMQRDEQEKPISSAGFDIMFSHRTNSLRYGMGLMYQNTGENVQYEAQIEIDSITDNSFYEIEEIYAEFIDSILVDGEWIDDTILVVIDVDSTFISDIDTSTYMVDDPTIGLSNGRTSIRTLSIPIQFGYEWQRRKSSWYFYGSIDPTLIIKRTAYYLHSGLNTRMDINQIDTYKKMTWRASLGVAWNRQLFKNGTYLILNPYSRFNLGSWNSSFEHRYFDIGIRFGLGIWLK